MNQIDMVRNHERRVGLVSNYIQVVAAGMAMDETVNEEEWLIRK